MDFQTHFKSAGLSTFLRSAFHVVLCFFRGGVEDGEDIVLMLETSIHDRSEKDSGEPGNGRGEGEIKGTTERMRETGTHRAEQT